MIELILATAAALTILTIALLAAARLSNHRPAHDPDDQAPTTHGTWTCPDCAQEVPVAIVTEHVIVARLDPVDVHAHLLTHQETPQ